jgi:hypothetical protein
MLKRLPAPNKIPAPSPTNASASGGGGGETPEIDAEWMKFMSRITRQMNCDTVDNDDDDSSNSSINGDDTITPTLHTLPPPLSGLPTVSAIHHTQDASVVKTAAAAKPKKSCISKKHQRRSYSFIDVDATATTATTDTTDTTATPPVVSLVRQKFTPIYISTKTKIAYLNQPVPIYDMFWNIPVQHYYKRAEGVIKKQIKFQTTDPATVAMIKEKLQQQPRCYEEYVIEHIDNPNGRIPFKDQRKVSIGISKKDLLGGTHKKKRAFFNCVVVILRINAGIAPPNECAPEDNILYKEMHVKVFNTGKLEIPGIQEDSTLTQVLQLLVSVLRPFLGDTLDYHRNRCETALINSNFNCGFYIDRDKLFHALKYKYRMNCNYDSCSYPGIQCKFYYLPDKAPHEQNGQQPVSMSMQYYEVSFMIFRTGSILIVGKCNEDILNTIYRFICTILEREYSIIQMGDIPTPLVATAAVEGVEGVDGEIAPKGVKHSRKKKLNITEIRFYNDDTPNI